MWKKLNRKCCNYQKCLYLNVQTMNISLPDDIKISEKDILTAVATRLYDTGKLNIEQAARMAGYNLSAFIEELTAQSLQEKSAVVYHY